MCLQARLSDVLVVVHYGMRDGGTWLGTLLQASSPTTLGAWIRWGRHSWDNQSNVATHQVPTTAKPILRNHASPVQADNGH